MTETIAANLNTRAKTPPAIVAEGLVKAYGSRVAVDNLSLSVGQGEVYALLGPNGAGKTSLINLLTTLTGPDKGQAWIMGRDVVKQAGEVRQFIGVTFQESALDKNLTGYRLLDIHGRLYGLTKSEIAARIAEMARLVELDEVLHERTVTYSGGMKRRLELARSLMTRPQVLFLDEPTVGLDIQQRAAIWQYVEYLKTEYGITILLTTHYMDEAARLADRVGIIDRGKLVIEGQPEKLVSKLGADMVKVQGYGDAARFVATLQQQPWAAFTAIFEVNPSDSIPKNSVDQTDAAVINRPLALVQIGLKQTAGPLLKPIIELAGQTDFQVKDMAVERPDLNDVFLAHTGRSLPD